LDCLFKHFGVHERELADATFGIRRLVNAWYAFVKPTIPTIHFKSDTDALETMQEYIGDAASFQSDADAWVSNMVNSILKQRARANKGEFDLIIDKIVLYLALQYDHHHAHQRYNHRLEALLGHPKITDAPTKAVIRRLLDAPHMASFDDIATLHVTLERLRKRKALFYKIQAVAPQGFATKAEYHSALDEYVVRLANTREIEESPIKPSELRSTIRTSIPHLKREGLITLSFGSHSESEVRQLEIPRFYKADVNDAGGQCYFGETIKTFWPATRPGGGPKGLRAALKQSQLDALDDEDEVATSQKKRVRPYYYRTFVLYYPDEWYPCYGIWSLYGGPVKGREILEDPQVK
jgi:hypothetical protein